MSKTKEKLSFETRTRDIVSKLESQILVFEEREDIFGMDYSKEKTDLYMKILQAEKSISENKMIEKKIDLIQDIDEGDGKNNLDKLLGNIL